MYHVYLKKGKENKILNGYTRIYANEVLKIEDKDKQGSICKILNFESKFIGYGYINHLSKIIVRVLTLYDEEISYDFFYKKIKTAYEERLSLEKIENTKSYRLFFGEADGIPGLIVDKYDKYLVVQILTLGIEVIKDMIIKILIDLVKPLGIYERSDTNEREKEGLEKKKGFLYQKFDTNLVIEENGLKVLIDIENGQKTGYFLDQRENRENLKFYAQNKEVLDCFSNIGGFSLHALKHGASKVTALDISEQAITSIKENMKLNNFTNYEAIKCDVFQKLRDYHKEKKSFDLIILDPPAFTKSKDTINNAYKGYLDINTLALKILKNNGYLITCSCSEHMNLDLFIKMAKESARHAKAKIKLKEIRIQAKDHAMNIDSDQSFYLKVLVLYKI